MRVTKGGSQAESREQKERSSKPYQHGVGNTDRAPLAAGSKSMLEGADDCLVGLSFVFTGVLDSLGREKAQNLVKRYGG